MIKTTGERTSKTAAVEFPTLLLVIATYGGWIAITLAYGHWPLIFVAPIGALLVTFHGSLQHEIVHGHPTRWPAVNRLMAMVPLTLWLPFARYRQSHLQHHRDDRLTDPFDDPESYYWAPEELAEFSPPTRALLLINQTLAGRMIVGPLWTIGRFFRHELRSLLRNKSNVRRVWLEHVLWCVPVVLWLKFVCGMPLWVYGLTMVLPATAIVLIRSFAEHRAHPGVRERIAIVERSWFLGPLFLFNNLHSLHHEAPSVPWYRYNARYRLIRERLVAENGGLVYVTYFDVARRFLLTPHDELQHPTPRIRVPQAG